MKDLFSLTNKKVLITGSAQGIGFLLAQGLAEQGADIIINDITDDRAQHAASQLRDAGFVAYACAFDVTNSQAVNNAIADIEENIGAIDVLINNAGIQRRHPFTEFPEKEWDAVIDVNQKSVFLVSQAVSRFMVKRQRGKIINICSMQRLC